jgi:hypothetical protein
MSLSAQQLAAQKTSPGCWQKSWLKNFDRRICAGKHLPGEMELGEQFGVSRTAVAKR